MHQDVESVLFTEAEILAGIDRLAERLTRDLGSGEGDLVVVSILKGSCIFASDLVRRLPMPLSLAFVYAQSYREGTEPGRLDVHLMPFDEELRGKRVLLVDDILDSGRTMAEVRNRMLERGAAQVRTCVFLDKPSRRAVELEADYACFEVEDRFVIGYGLDHAGRYRNLPYVGILRAELSGAGTLDPLDRGEARSGG